MNPDETQLKKLFDSHPVLGKLRASTCRKLIAAARVDSIQKGKTICREADPVGAFWLLVSGEVKLVRHTSKGQVLLIDIVLPNELFGVVYYQHHPTYPCSAIAIKTARVVQLPIKHLRIESDGNGALTRALLEDTCLKLCHSLRMRGLMLEDAPVRVATLLLNLTEKFGPVIPETRAVLAELSGLTVETAIRITRSMAAEGILKTRRGSLEILDPVALRKKAGENGFSHEHLEHSSNGRGETA